MNHRQLTALFNRIPDDIVLSVATRDLSLIDGNRCLCGWVLRESIASTLGQDADDVSFNVWTIEEQLGAAFGGRPESWGWVFGGVTIASTVPRIELAWVNRIDKAVRRSAA